MRTGTGSFLLAGRAAWAGPQSTGCRKAAMQCSAGGKHRNAEHRER